MTFRELAGREEYPPGRELLIRELCRAIYASGRTDELRSAVRAAIRHVRALAPRVDGDRRARMAALDAACAGDELARMARIARVGVGRG